MGARLSEIITSSYMAPSHRGVSKLIKEWAAQEMMMTKRNNLGMTLKIMLHSLARANDSVVYEK